jgi:hypothetical protein
MTDEACSQAVYTIGRASDEVMALAAEEPLPPLLVDYLMERRRAIITELRKLEAMLALPQSIPARQRPH